MNNAIVALTRGYNNVNDYDTLISRNNAIYTHINSKYNNQYPLILFHEGNITQEHQNYIVANGNGQSIKFIDIKPVWEGGYASMCRFYTFHIWYYCLHLGIDNILRIDEDCIITDATENPFDKMDNKIFLKSASWAESHHKTNETLPYYLERLTGVNKDTFYTHNFPYTNVMVSNVKFWIYGNVGSIIHDIGITEHQIKYRWGDLPIFGALLNIFGGDKVDMMSGFSYIHISHNNQIIKSKN